MEVHQIYEAAFEGNLPKTAISLVVRRFPDASAVLAEHDPAVASRGFVLRRGPLSQAMDATAMQEFAEHWRLPVGHVYHEGDLAADAQGHARLSDGPPRGAEESDRIGRAGVVLRRDIARQTVLELRFRHRRENAIRPAIQTWLAAATPHLMRATRIGEVRRKAALEASLSSRIVELLPFAVFIIDGARSVHKMNRRAEMLAAEMKALFVGADDTLHATEPESDVAFTSALHKLRTNPAMHSDQMAFRRGRDEGIQLLTIAKLGASLDGGSPDRTGESESASQFAVIAHNCAESLNLTPHALWNTFGLTTRESELAISLLNGESLGDYAVRRQISKQTLRNQLGGIMRKTDTHRQPELVTLLTRLALTVPY